MSGADELESGRSDHQQPHSGRNPIPTVQQYRANKAEEQESLQATDAPAETNNWRDAAKAYWYPEKYGEEKKGANPNLPQPDHNDHNDSDTDDPRQQGISREDQAVRKDRAGDLDENRTQPKNPKQHRKQLEKRGANYAEREVTDPVTHLSVTIRDFTDKELHTAEEQYPQDNLQGISREEATEESTAVHKGMDQVFPPPSFETARDELANVHKSATLVGLGAILIIGWITIWVVLSVWHRCDPNRWRIARLVAAGLPALLGTALAIGTIWTTQQWAESRTRSVWDDQVWEADRVRGTSVAKQQEPESTQWLNMLVGTVWPLINPELFESLTDMLEDVMQASLPRMVRMVSVEDLGQGNEPIRIIGIKRLPKGAASHSVAEDGKLRQGSSKSKSMNKPQDREAQRNHVNSTQDANEDVDTDANNRRKDDDDDDDQGGEGQDSAVADGMEAEEGEFFNVEVAFAYRSTRSRRAQNHAKHLHLLIAFYLPGGIKLPVWVELHGLVGTLRARLQLIPDPPFVNLLTFTFLGQPKVDLSCVPLVRTGLNIMDLPLISNFVQSAVDAGLSQYVAPKSKTLDIKDMISGDDFKKDVVARGILRIKIRRAYDFKEGDAHVPLISFGSSDSYVSVGFAKFGKPIWSTRVIVDEMHPYWEEVTHIPIGPEELDAEESLRVSLWDSDKLTADDDLGRIELGLKDLIKNDKSNGKDWLRTDSFESMKAGERMPGRLEWSVGYYSKTRLMEQEIAQHHNDASVNTVQEFKDKIEREAAEKLREAGQDNSAEVEQQKTQNYKDAAIDLITSSTPLEEYPSGILSLQIHQITDLEYEIKSKSRNVDAAEDDDVEEQGDSLPSTYCTILLNHTKIYKTRTKPKNSKPFFNAATERFVRDWRTTSIFISVRDARVHEDDALMGIVHIPLGKLLKSRKTSRINENFPLAGGIGYGRIRISLVFRSVQLQETPEHLGWDYGTLEVQPTIESEGLSGELASHALRFRTTLTKVKLSHQRGQAGIWKYGHDRPFHLAITKRYASNLIIELRRTGHLLGGNKTTCIAVLWLCTIPDEEERTLSLPVWKGELKRASTCTLPDEECGERVGTLKLKLRFCRGLGRFHEKYAFKNQDATDVMEVLQCANDNRDMDETVGRKDWQVGGGEGQGRDSEDDDSDDVEDVSNAQHRGADGGRTLAKRDTRHSADSSRSGLHGMLDDAKSYVKHKDQLHRRERGIMQWKVPRTVKWIKHKGDHVKQRLSGVFDHHGREPDVETEV